MAAVTVAPAAEAATAEAWGEGGREAAERAAEEKAAAAPVVAEAGLASLEAAASSQPPAPEAVAEGEAGTKVEVLKEAAAVRAAALEMGRLVVG